MPLSDKTVFEQAVNVVSTRIRLILYQIPENSLNKIYEIRLRVNKPVVIVSDSGCCFLTDKGRLTALYSDNCVTVNGQELNDTVNRVCNYSVHSYQQNINSGFVTINGGHRVGLCGTASFGLNNEFNVRDITCLNIRIARQVFGVSEKITEYLFDNDLPSVIIAGPPSSGKTTLLRDIAYRLSSGFCGSFYKVSVIDERGEFSAPYNSIAQNDLGLNSDVLINYNKRTATDIAIRTLSPDYIVFDEITSENELNSIKAGLNSGVGFAVSIHCGNEYELKDKQLLIPLLKTKEFKYIIMLSSSKTPCKIEKILKINYCDDEISWSNLNISMQCTDGTV